MEALQENFYYSNSTSGTDGGGLEKERQLLVKEQKLCRARSRKFFLETIRRRKALEDRRKLWDVQEQRLRETVLQQRRQRVQDATERFQRAHLPLSQRRRQSFKRNVPSIEDALNHIQGSLSSNNRQSSFVSISRSRTPSPKTPTKPKTSQCQALSAVEAYTKLLQERSVTFRNNQETWETRDKQQDNSPQENSLSDCIHSESISSKDSLEFEEPKHGTKNLQSSSMSFVLDTDKCLLDLKEHSDLPTFTTKMLLGDTLSQSRKLHELKQKKRDDSEVPNNKNNFTKCSWGLTTNEKTPQTEIPHSRTLRDILSSTKQCGVRSTENSPNGNLIVLNGIPPSNTELVYPSPKQEPVLDLRQLKANDERQLKHPPATEILLPTKNGNSKDCLFGNLKPNIFLNNCTMDNTCQEGTLEQAGKDKDYVSSRKESNASINNLNKFSDVEFKTEKKTLNNTRLNNNQSHTSKCLKCPEKEEPKSAVSLETPGRVCEVRFIKGILKKHSKYMSGEAACVFNSGHLTLTKQVALAIRDSVELTRAKNKELESNVAVKKKLRWFDEVHVDNEDDGRNIIKQIKGSLSQSKNNPEDHQLSLTSVLGAIKPGPYVTHTAPDRYHFTWQAWADVGVQVNLPQQHRDEVKVPPSNNKTSGPKVPLKERTEAGPVSSRTRKGTNIRPQSATEVSQIAKTHGRLVMPRPPPRMDAIEEQKVFVTTAPYGTDHANVNYKPPPGAEHALQKESRFALYTKHEIKTDRSVLYTPHPPSYACPACPESNTKSKPWDSHQETPCLNCTPTEEEISQLWHGVRTALASKDAALSKQAVDTVRVGRRHSAGLGIRRPPQSTQPTKQTPDQVRLFSIAHGMTSPDNDLHSFVHLSRDEIHNDRSQKTVETTQPQRPGTLQQQQQHSQRHGMTSLSMEEQKILLSLDRLNHQLHYVQEHVHNTATRDFFLGHEGQSTAGPNATNQKHQAVSYRSRYQKL